MTREDIILLSQLAGFNWPDISRSTIEERLERFAALVAAAEREACARICDEERKFWKRHEGRRDGAAS